MKYLLKMVLPGFVLLLAGCSAFVDVAAPPQLTGEEYVFSSDETAEQSVRGLYSKMGQQDNFSDCMFSLLLSLMSDDLVSTAASPTRDVFQNNSLLPGNTMVTNNFWRKGYEYIYHANACLQGLQNSTGVSAARNKQLTGEMHLMRAFLYYHMVNLFGGVPLQTGIDYAVNKELPRASEKEVWDLIIADAVAATQELGSYVAGDVKTRPCKEAALAFLSRVQLYRQHWQQAIDAATKVINSRMYVIEENLSGVFLTTSKEVIWQLGFNSEIPMIMQATTYIPASALLRPQLTATASLMAAFEAGDMRQKTWLRTVIVGGKNYYYPFKYISRAIPNITEKICFMRLAEVYLNRAEAYLHLGNITAAVADVNLIRKRANLPALPDTISAASLEKTIANERRVEMMFEWGHRWYDLKRTSQANAVLGKEKGSYWQPSDQLLPIPDEEIQLNPNLVQNPGYQ
ncbi:RagB/SusD family nutrient uptake outer membrane protein [Filimonas effusa]|uniref:RagB/SusD family nutrient uptake outer membrane protein n=1 Tax=Filimonas effusa TaxID=2508721 RepID=A0A4Q1D1L9_9BACT|nr:RagB/SusD family nutrient uptake outer membrane protein [Filimonas effusa]RXK81768.1 RagB/SusD family nutrient uptake outer membrane protein [Filimonas effusa]